jgi:hypothetical protein
MSRKNVLAAAIVGIALVGAWGTAHAVPTATINGITFPIGIVPGGNQIQSGILDENLITASGQTLMGVGRVSTISDPSLAQVWGNGQNGMELAFVFNNFKSDVAAFPTVTFTGGTVSFYTLAAGTPITGYGSIAADMAAIQAGTLWLTLTAAPQTAGPAGDTLVSTIQTGTSLSAFSVALGSTFLDVAGGPAAGAFDTGTFANAFDVANGGFSDISLTSDFSSGSLAEGFGISGSATLKANAIPEPISLGLLGVGLLGLGMARRWRR